jgi:hypothetical protein
VPFIVHGQKSYTRITSSIFPPDLNIAAKLFGFPLDHQLAFLTNRWNAPTLGATPPHVDGRDRDF